MFSIFFLKLQQFNSYLKIYIAGFFFKSILLVGIAMTRRNQKKSYNRPKKNQNHERKFEQRLDMRRLTYFRYDMKEIFNSTDMDPKVWNPVLASTVTKASRLGIKGAKEYIESLVIEDVLDEKIAKELIRILDRYKKWR
jgi:hypothetical protein